MTTTIGDGLPDSLVVQQVFARAAPRRMMSRVTKCVTLDPRAGERAGSSAPPKA